MPGLAAAALWLAAGTDPSFIDTGIAGVRLGDERSGSAFVRQHGEPEANSADAIPSLRFTTASKTELLELFIHPGSVRGAFMEFRVSRLRGEPGAAAPTAIKTFASARGVHLGLALDGVVRILGAASKRTARGNSVTLEYRCTSSARCQDLVRVNMPEYEARYVFKHGYLDEFQGGYPYP